MNSTNYHALVFKLNTGLRNSTNVLFELKEVKRLE